MPADQTTLYSSMVDHIGDDFTNWRSPFDSFTAPERDVLDRIDFPHTESKLRFLTFSAALDYQRDADLHWKEMKTLYNEHLELFSPLECRSIGQDEIQELFGDYRIRFPNRDGKTWSTIASTLLHDYDNSVSFLIDDSSFDAHTLYRTIRKENFPFLGGDKIAPFWIRLVHEHAIELESLSRVPIAVDAQVRATTTEIDPSIETDDDVRSFWQRVCQDSDYAPLEIDEALWLIGRNIDGWGRMYLDDVQQIQ